MKSSVVIHVCAIINAMCVAFMVALMVDRPDDKKQQIIAEMKDDLATYISRIAQPMTTAERDSHQQIDGMIIKNTDSGAYEILEDGEWIEIGLPAGTR